MASVEVEIRDGQIWLMGDASYGHNDLIFHTLADAEHVRAALEVAISKLLAKREG